MPEGLASEPIRALVPYKDGCVTSPQAHSLNQQMVSSRPQLVSPASVTWPHNCTPYVITQISLDLVVTATKTTTAVVSAITLLRSRCIPAGGPLTSLRTRPPRWQRRACYCWSWMAATFIRH